MHRLLVPTAELESGNPVLPADAAHHLRVLRPKPGEAIELFDGCGASRVFAYAKDALVPQAPAVRAERPVPLVLFACVTKGARWDWTVEKATELGATRIVPVISDRTIVRVASDERDAKRVRWRRNAQEAARQSDAKWIPEVLAPVSFAESLGLVSETACFVGALTDPAPQPIGRALAACAASEVRPFAVYVGPEGDFTPDELAALLAVATPVSFGPTVLRAETAAIFGLAAVKAFMEARA